MNPLPKTSENDRCYSEPELLDFSLGKLPEPDADAISRHLEECEECEITVVGFDQAEDTLVGKIARESLPEAEEDNQLAPLIERIKQKDFDSVARKAKPHRLPAEIGEYRIAEVLGKGGMGTVFRATHNRLEKEVALKVLPDRKMQNPESIDRFRREMRIVGRLDHPAIIQATDAGEEHGVHFLAMEFVDGFDLSQLTRYVEAISPANCCEVVRQAALGLEYVHSQCVIHRDIKPSNLMLTRNGQVKIMDLGLAMLSGLHGAVDELTTVGQMMGTLDYMAPEQYGDSHNVNHLADVYSLGATLYKLLTGEAPYHSGKDESPLQKMKRVATEEIPTIESRIPEINPGLASIVNRCLKKEETERFESAMEVARALEPFAENSDLPELVKVATEKKELLERNNDSEVDFDQLPIPDKSIREEQEQTQLSELAEKVAGLKESFDSDRKGRFPWWLKTALAFFGFALFAVGGILIQIEMNKGQLVIESESDNVQVTLLKDGKFYEEMELQQGTNSTKIRAGKYEVTIDDPSDKLLINRNEFKIKRGDMIVATIRHKKQSDDTRQDSATEDRNVTKMGMGAPSSESSDLGNELVYQGLTLERWLLKLKSDVFDSEKAGSLTTLKVAPIIRLAPHAEEKTLSDAADFWAQVMEKETSASQIYRLTNLANALAVNEQDANKLVHGFLLGTLRSFSGDPSNLPRITTNTGGRSRPFSTMFDRWSPDNDRLVQKQLFSDQLDDIKNIDLLRHVYLSRIMQRNLFTFADPLIKYSESNDLQHKVQAVAWMLEAARRQSKPTDIKEAKLLDSVTERFKELAANEKDSAIRAYALEGLVQLAPDTPQLGDQVAKLIPAYPELTGNLALIKNKKPGLEKVHKLLEDPDWGWGSQDPNPPAFSLDTDVEGMGMDMGMGGESAMGDMDGGMGMGPGEIRRSGIPGGFGGASGMLGNSMGGGMMSMGGGMEEMMGGGGGIVSTSPRFKLVSSIIQLGEIAEPLLPTLGKQQEIASNSDYLNLVWNAIESISGKPKPKLYAGKDLSFWKQQFDKPRNDAEFAMSIVACADIIGEVRFDERIRDRGSSSRTSRSSRLSNNSRTAFIEFDESDVANKEKYVQFLAELLPRLRKYDFESFSWDISEIKKVRTAYKDPKMAAYLVSQSFVLPLLNTAKKEDFPFLVCLNPAPSVRAYQEFISASLSEVKAGSFMQARATLHAEVANPKHVDLMIQLAKDRNAHPIARLAAFKMFPFAPHFNAVRFRGRILTADEIRQQAEMMESSVTFMEEFPADALRRLPAIAAHPVLEDEREFAIPLACEFAVQAKSLESKSKIKLKFSARDGTDALDSDELEAQNSTLVSMVLDVLETSRQSRRRSKYENVEVEILKKLRDKLEPLKPKVDSVTRGRIQTIVEELDQLVKSR